MDVTSITNRILSKYAGSNSEFVKGYANLEGLLHKKYGDYNYGIVIGKRLDYGIMDSVSQGPNLDYYKLYNRANRELREIGIRISEELTAVNIPNIPVPPTENEEEIKNKYEDTLRSDFSHKMAATRAGIGWIGKTGLLITKEFGPRLRLVTVLVKEPLICSPTPYNESRCGRCSICVEKCPAGAANGKSWDINTDRDEFLNAYKCRQECRRLSMQMLNKDISICGICISVCPIGKK